MNKLIKCSLALLASSLCVLADNPAPAAPKIVCDQPDFDIGFAEPNTYVNHDYVIRNAGETTLELKNVRATCGCTVAKTSTNMVKPGETATITATLNLTGRSGRQDKHVIVESNDPVTPTMILNLHCTVREDYSFSPQNISGSVRGDEAVEFSVLFTNSTPSALHLTKATSSVSNLTAKIETVVDGRAYRILVKTVPVLGAGQLNATIHLETDSAAKPSFDIPVSVSVLAALTVAPQALTIQGPSAAPVTRYIIIRSGSVQTFKILSVEPPAPGITVETSPFGNQGTRITLSNIIPTAELNGKNVKITTDVPAMNEILVPFSVVQ